MGWGGRWEGGSGWGIHVNPWLIHVNVWQKPLQYCKVISLQLIKINEKQQQQQKEKKRNEIGWVQKGRGAQMSHAGSSASSPPSGPQPEVNKEKVCFPSKIMSVWSWHSDLSQESVLFSHQQHLESSS